MSTAVVLDEKLANYAAFLERKTQDDSQHGFEPVFMPEFLFPFQRGMVEWSTRKGHAGLFEDCGLGKTPQQLVWAENVYRKTGHPVLLVAPLAVTFQTLGEAEKFGIDAAVSRDGTITAGITITNYDRLHHFEPAIAERTILGMVCDESSAIKSFDSERKDLVTRLMRKLPYRLLCTATAAPNDYIELGTSSEALGYLGYQDMLSRFFTNKDRSSHPNRPGRHYKTQEAHERGGWRFKGHAEAAFWQWVASWARAMRRPSDLGYSDEGFVRPPVQYRQHIVDATRPPEDRLFDVVAAGLREEREELRRTLDERVAKAVEIVNESHRISSKLAACGSLNTRSDGEPNTQPIPTNANGASDKGEARKRTANTCAPTTPPTPRSSSAHPNSRSGSTPLGERATPATPSTASDAKPKPAAETRTPCVTDGSDRSSGSAPPTSTQCSPSKAAAAPSAASPLAMREDTGSTSITVTNPGGCEASSAGPAISASASLGTIPNGSEQRRNTSPEPWIVWCQSNAEQQALERAFGDRAISVHGGQSPDEKEQGLLGFQRGERPILITKPSVAAWGLNFQHCANMVYFPDHSYERFYQAVRRCDRFGQTRPVTVHVVTTEGGRKALSNLQRKATQADRMHDALVAHMASAQAVERGEHYDHEVRVPAWL